MSEQNPDSQRSERLIYDRQAMLEEMLDVFTDRASEVDLSPAVKRKIAVHIVNYHRVLSNYHDEPILSEGDIPDISPIRNRLGQTAEVMTQTPRRGDGVTYREVPAVDELDFWYLEDTAKQLEAAAKKLGFWKSAKSKNQVFGVDPEWDSGEGE